MPLLSFEELRPRIHPTAFVAPTATLVGDVIVEEGASIWYGVVIRADYAPVIVRRRANVQDNAVVHGSPGLTTDIGVEVTVGHIGRGPRHQLGLRVGAGDARNLHQPHQIVDQRTFVEGVQEPVLDRRQRGAHGATLRPVSGADLATRASRLDVAGRQYGTTVAERSSARIRRS